MKPIPDWRASWRFWSVRAMTLALALQGAWVAIPESLRDNIGGDVKDCLTAALLFCGIWGRLVLQQPTNGAKDQ